MGIIIGGLLPAVLFGIIGVFQKLGAQTGVDVSVWLASFGAAMLLFGCVGILVSGAVAWSAAGVAYGAGAGCAYAMGSGALTLAIVHFREPISKLIPVVNISTLVTALAALIWLDEASEVDGRQLAIGAVLTIAGVSLVMRA